MNQQAAWAATKSTTRLAGFFAILVGVVLGLDELLPDPWDFVAIVITWLIAIWTLNYQYCRSKST